ncbi:head maturation protease, ClpP-related [Pacificoceanicola onchidii]|uniref:head maturation protease, ClpP-related n=1 Tax=Pacificoceanicola onchidii TaxID=2562685 RepID=UPI0010A48616|nr:head maturation protease, ClpP-related [Pacificoceanicola onchidii]
MTSKVINLGDVRERGLRSDFSLKALKQWNPDIRASSSDDEATISVLDTIGKDWWGEGVTAKRIASALRNIGARDVVVNINSPGGDFFEGLAIYNLLAEHAREKGAVTVKVLGLAASAASVIAMGGSNVLIAKSAFLMIHNTWVVAAGDRHAFREVADWLEPFDFAAAELYQDRSGMDLKDIQNMLDKETWLPGSKSVENGFADGLLGAEEVGSGASNSTALTPQAAQKKIDIALARSDFTKSQRRELYAAVKGGMSGAAPSGTSSAAVTEVAQSALDKLNSL